MKNTRNFSKITARTLLFVLLLSALLCCDLFAAEPNTLPRRPRGPRNLWGQYSKNPDSWYQSEEGIRIANNILSWQSPKGSWPKNIYKNREPLAADTNTLLGTIDNRATLKEIR